MSNVKHFDRFVKDRLTSDLQSEALAHSSVVCAATDGAPVVFVSDAFEVHTGYSQTEAVGKSLSFLQGPGTEDEAVSRFRQLIRAGEPGRVCITNYRKDGSKFRHECDLRPVHDEYGKVTHFIAIQRVV